MLEWRVSLYPLPANNNLHKIILSYVNPRNIFLSSKFSLMTALILPNCIFRMK
ncbi:hypothetical protein yrohd0001_13760 [Yersinia rohdei ATCC 43380]|nr:hypothetical protein yrohd0001_13760 [Yersinia rohdei ATCC 43380]